MRRKVSIFLQAFCLFLAALSILIGFGHFAGYHPLDIGRLYFSLDQNLAHTTGEQVHKYNDMPVNYVLTCSVKY
jgi:hypothetical protein